jgi:hypothetical protein
MALVSSDIPISHEEQSLLLSQVITDSRVLVCPFCDVSSHVRGVVQVIRNRSGPVLDDSFEYFQIKCRMYARWLFQPVLDDFFASDLI